FVMDDVETTSELALAQIVLELGARDILVGGLGLGFTLRALLDSPHVRHIVVAEIESEIVVWMRHGTIPGADLLDDPRAEILVEDVRAVVTEQPRRSLDAIVLDVDNGPDFLVRDANAAIYGPEFVTICAERLRANGTLCVWSMSASAQLAAALRAVFVKVTERSIPVRLQDRDEHYWIFTGSSPR
ncbi:MAG: hypothetical protein JWQ70_1659, partial [Aeromicrobium sp.]|nr:hypothetical protein [Aeromicrobium sp.]